MFKTTTRRLAAAAITVTMFIGIAACGSGTAGSSEYPNKPITLVVPYGAGGGSDVIATVFVDALERAAPDVDVRRVNMPGAGGSQGTRYVLEAQPDGYTVGLSDPGPALALPLTQDVGYKPGDMTHLGRVTQYGFGIVVRSDGPYKTMKDIVSAARAGTELTYASSGPLAVDAIGAELLAKATGVRFRGVPFSGSGEATLAVMAGDVDFGAPSMSAALEAIGGGRLTMVATTLPADSESIEGIENVPTASKAGADFAWESFRGLVAPPGVPAEVIAFWDKAFEKMKSDPELTKALADAGERWAPLGSQGMQEYFTKLSKTVEPVVKGIQQ